MPRPPGTARLDNELDAKGADCGMHTAKNQRLLLCFVQDEPRLSNVGQAKLLGADLAALINKKIPQSSFVPSPTEALQARKSHWFY